MAIYGQHKGNLRENIQNCFVPFKTIQVPLDVANPYNLNIYIYIHIYIYTHIYIYIHIYIYVQPLTIPNMTKVESFAMLQPSEAAPQETPEMSRSDMLGPKHPRSWCRAETLQDL